MKIIRTLLGGLAALACSNAMSAVLLSENFNNVSGLFTPSGWVQSNLSVPTGTSNWFQGNPGVFAAADGPANSYIAANYMNGAENAGGTISNWLMTPTVTLFSGLQLSFDLRLKGDGFLDTLEVLFSGNGASTAITDFDSLISYSSISDTGWLEKTLIVGGVNAPTSGRFAFRYTAQNTDVEANYIGIDSVLVQSVPEPASLALLSLALVGAAATSRRRSA